VKALKTNNTSKNYYNTFSANIPFIEPNYIQNSATFFQKQGKAKAQSVLKWGCSKLRKNAFPTIGRNYIFAARFLSAISFQNPNKATCKVNRPGRL